MGQPPNLPWNHRTLQGTKALPPAANSPPTVIARQGKQSLFSRLADFLYRKDGSATWPSPPADHSSPGPLAVIGLVTSDADRCVLSGICARSGWPLVFADTPEDARVARDKLKAPVILCDRDLPGSGWRQTVEVLASSPHRACVILLSGVVDTYLWDEVARTGGYDVLSKPLREDEVVRVVRLAWSYWNSATRNTPLPRT
jgi:CheY-like chemotaxis protein